MERWVGAAGGWESVISGEWLVIAASLAMTNETGSRPIRY